MASNPRLAHPAVESLFLQRWSPRAFDASLIDEADVRTLSDAARWAPSAFNAQPWRFLYARRDDAHWPAFLDMLLPFNRAWAERSSLLVVIVSDTLRNSTAGAPTPSPTHSFDAGAAWALLALQATRLGLQAHGMAGFDAKAARTTLALPDRFAIELVAAVGRPADKSILPEALQLREQPSDRKPIDAIAAAGPYAFPAQD